MPEDRIDVTGLWGAVEGYAIGALESPRASITTLSRHFGFDAVETEGVIRFVMRGRASVATVAPDDLVATREGDVLELTQGQETELPQALKWQLARADEDYDAVLVEARRITVDTTRITSESFPMAVTPEEAERRCRRALMEAWVGREQPRSDCRPRGSRLIRPTWSGWRMTGGCSICGLSPLPMPRPAASKRSARIARVTTCRPAILAPPR